MHVVDVLPWCRLDKTYCVGKVTMRRVCRGGTPPQHSLSCAAAKAFDVFRDLCGKPLSEIVLVEDTGDSGDDRETADAVEIACFSALANRDFEIFGNTPENLPDTYCNADLFRRFSIEIADSSCRVTSAIRRRDGVLAMTDISAAYAPLETGVNAGPIRLDENLSVALAQFREKAGNGEWGRLRDSIDYFNQANTDNPLLARRAAWALLCGAFQRFLSADPNKALTKADCTGKCLTRSLKESGVPPADGELLGCWLKQFCELRNDPAHGRRHSPKNSNWALRHHLLIAILAFPLLVGPLVQPAGTDERLTKVCALACFARRTKQPKERLSLLGTASFDQQGPKTWRQFLAEYQKAPTLSP
jgi:hypothetical protein